MDTLETFLQLGIIVKKNPKMDPGTNFFFQKFGLQRFKKKNKYVERGYLMERKVNGLFF